MGISLNMCFFPFMYAYVRTLHGTITVLIYVLVFQGLELSGGGGTESSSSYGVSSKGTHKRGELEVSAELMLAGPELVMKDPTNSVTGTALKGLLTAQAAIGVSIFFLTSYDNLYKCTLYLYMHV